MPNSYHFVFWGTSDFSVIVFEKLLELGIKPELIITAPDKPSGRGQKVTFPPLKVKAMMHHIPVLQPPNLKDLEFLKVLTSSKWDFFLVASYGKIIPQNILNIPSKNSLNIHPSLLPLYRGPSPIQEQILQNEEYIGTTIMLMDSKVDHGDIIAQKEIPLERKEGELTQRYSEIEKKLAEESAILFSQILPEWLSGNVKPQKQIDGQATFTTTFSKEDSLVDLLKPRELYRKYLALTPRPGTYFFVSKN